MIWIIFIKEISFFDRDIIDVMNLSSYLIYFVKVFIFLFFQFRLIVGFQIMEFKDFDVKFYNFYLFRFLCNFFGCYSDRELQIFMLKYFVKYKLLVNVQQWLWGQWYIYSGESFIIIYIVICWIEKYVCIFRFVFWFYLCFEIWYFIEDTIL